LKIATGFPVIVRRVAWQDRLAISACGSYAALVAEIADRIRFSKHFVILGDIQSLVPLDAQIGAGGCYAGMTQ